MDPRVILVKPPHLPPLPAYEGDMRRLRLTVLAMPVYVVFLVAVTVYLGLSPTLMAIADIPLVLAISYLMWFLTRSRARTVAAMTGEQPIVVADEIDGGFELRPFHLRRWEPALRVSPGDTVSVRVRRGIDSRKGPTRELPVVHWRFESRGGRRLVVGTYFDADRALLRDVETRLKGLGVKVEITHTPYGGGQRA